MSNKGGANERDLAKRLSLWWSGGTNDDIFWRVQGSGGRAKSRGRKGKDTYEGHGDIRATDPIGAPLTEVFTIEAKKGYPTTKANPFESIDRIKTLIPGKDNFPGWIKQVEESNLQARTPYWMIVFQRPRRMQMVCMPGSILAGSSRFTADERYQIRCAVNARFDIEVEGVQKYLAFAPLDELLEFLTPKMVQRVARVQRNRSK